MSEIGIFYRAIIEEEERKKVESLTDNWISANLQYEGLQEVIKTISKEEREKAKKGPSQKEVRRDWNRLAAFMGKVKNGG